MPRESMAARKQRAKKILELLMLRFPDAHIELNYERRQPWQLLVAVMLSAQCTDVKVNQVTPALFKKYPDLDSFARADVNDVKQRIKSLGLAATKAKNIVASARVLQRDHQGQVPADRQQLEALPGIGRKSASVILANAFGIPALAVDTHVGRVSRRMGLTKEKNPDKVEQALEALWPKSNWLQAHHIMIWQGRRICSARKPDCAQCPVQQLCWQVDLPPAKDKLTKKSTKTKT